MLSNVYAVWNDGRLVGGPVKYENLDCRVTIPFMSFSSHFRFLFWPTKLRTYYIIVYLLFYYFYFRLACLALQNAKTEHMEMKISQPIFGVFW